MQLIDRDLQHIWHPCAQMKDYEQFPPLPIQSARGCHINLSDGRQIIDAISSWWCKSLGHAHPRIHEAIKRQLDRFEHVILAHTTHEVIVELGEYLASLTPHLRKSLFAADGSCAVEMALKMSVHAQQHRGQEGKTRFMALANGYHGETALCLAVSDLGLYKQPYHSLMQEYAFIKNIPYRTGPTDTNWMHCDREWAEIEVFLNQHSAECAAIIIEPVVQGAGGMQIYSPALLQKLRHWCDEKGVYFIADEIMTGLGRTGLPLACDHAGIEPDFLCLAKGLTAGTLPMSVMLTRDAIYDLFYDDYETQKAFMHSHTHSGNALAAAVALEVSQIMQEEGVYEQVKENQAFLATLFQEVADKTQRLTNIRHLGYVVAGDICLAGSESSSSRKRRLGFEVYQEAVKWGALLRPLGNTLYWFPPLTMTRQEMRALQKATQHALMSLS